MIGPRWWFLIFVIVVIGLIMKYNLLVLFGVLLALASGAAALWSKYCLNSLTYRRKLKSDRIFCGEETDLSIEITNAKPLPLPWLWVSDRFPSDLALVTGKLSTTVGDDEETVTFLYDLMSIRWYERLQRTYRVRGNKRGLYEFGPVSLISGDLFGLDQKYMRFSDTDHLLVYPKVVPVTEFGLPFERPGGEVKATRKVIQDPLRMATVREYVPGDSPRHIHWKNSARTDKLQTKVFDPSANPTLVIFCDLQTHFYPYNFVPEFLELVITACASMAIHALSMRQSVGLYVNGGPRNAGYWTFVSPGRSPSQGTRILDTLAPLVGFRLVPMHQLLHRVLPVLPYGSTIMPVTATVNGELFATLLRIRDAGHPIKLLTVGDTAPTVPAIFDTFHLGGRDAWHRLEALELA
ncbi:MAG: DUF58 domain-containing protein [Anaerolineae bacterium]|nr:DUF58 domain-containing protein [Anaerolineae bacterium]